MSCQRCLGGTLCLTCGLQQQQAIQSQMAIQGQLGQQGEYGSCQGLGIQQWAPVAADPYRIDPAKHEALTRRLHELEAEHTTLLAENATLRREIERLRGRR